MEKKLIEITKKHYGEILTNVIEATGENEEDVCIEIKIKTKKFESNLK